MLDYALLLRRRVTDTVQSQLRMESSQDALLALLARLGMVAGSYLSIAVISRGLSVAQFGVVSFILSTQALLSTAIELGLTPAIIRYASFYLGSGESSRAYSIYKIGLVVKIALNALILWLGIAFAQTIAIDVYRDVSLSIPLVSGFVLACCTSFQNYFIGVLRSANRFGLMFVALLVQYGVQVILLGLLWGRRQLTIDSIIVAYVAGYGLFMLLCAVKYPWRHVIKSSIFPERAHFGRYWAFLKWMALGYIASSLILPVNVLLLQYQRSSDEVALYYSAYKIAQIFWILENTLGFVLLPKLSHLAGQRGIDGVRPIVDKLLVGVTGLAVTIALIVGLLAVPLTQFLFGDQYLPSVSILYWLLPVGALYLITNPAGIMLISLGRPDINAKLGCLAVVINLIANMALVPTLGAIGTAIAALLAFLIIAVGVWLSIRRLTYNPFAILQSSVMRSPSDPPEARVP